MCSMVVVTAFLEVGGGRFEYKYKILSFYGLATKAILAKNLRGDTQPQRFSFIGGDTQPYL